jgi:hypothetical protein
VVEFPVFWIAHDLIRRTRWPLKFETLAGASRRPRLLPKPADGSDSLDFLDYMPPISVGKVLSAQGSNALNRRPVSSQVCHSSRLISIWEVPEKPSDGSFAGAGVVGSSLVVFRKVAFS